MERDRWFYQPAFRQASPIQPAAPAPTERLRGAAVCAFLLCRKERKDPKDAEDPIPIFPATFASPAAKTTLPFSVPSMYSEVEQPAPLQRAVNGRAADGTIRRSDGMTSREAPAGPAGRIDHVDEGKSFEGKLFCTGGRSGGLRSPSWGACVPPRGDAGRRTRENAALAPSKRLRGGALLRRSQAEVRGLSTRPFAPSLARKPPCMRRDAANKSAPRRAA